MARKSRKAAKKASSSLLMLLIISAAILAFLPFRMTLATGSASTELCAYLGKQLAGTITGVTNGCSFLMALTGTHISLDAFGILLAANASSSLASTFGAGGALSGIGSNGYLGLKAQKITVDILSANNTAISGLFSPYGSNPTASTGGAISTNTIEIRLIMLSVTLTGYTVPGSHLNQYGEVNLQALNPALMVSFDRAFLDLFIDPYSNIAVYSVSADMTVYQGLALLLQAATL